MRPVEKTLDLPITHLLGHLHYLGTQVLSLLCLMLMNILQDVGEPATNT